MPAAASSWQTPAELLGGSQPDYEDLINSQDPANGNTDLTAFADTWDDSKGDYRAIRQQVPLPPNRFMQPPFHQVAVPQPPLRERIRLSSDRTRHVDTTLRVRWASAEPDSDTTGVITTSVSASPERNFHRRQPQPDIQLLDPPSDADRNHDPPVDPSPDETDTVHPPVLDDADNDDDVPPLIPNQTPHHAADNDDGYESPEVVEVPLNRPQNPVPSTHATIARRASPQPWTQVQGKRFKDRSNKFSKKEPPASTKKKAAPVSTPARTQSSDECSPPPEARSSTRRPRRRQPKQAAPKTPQRQRNSPCAGIIPGYGHESSSSDTATPDSANDASPPRDFHKAKTS